jgi:hypothetical protein
VLTLCCSWSSFVGFIRQESSTPTIPLAKHPSQQGWVETFGFTQISHIKTTTLMRSKWGLWLSSRVWKVSVGELSGVWWPLYQEVASTVVKRYSRTTVKQDAWQKVLSAVLHLSPGSLVLLLFPFSLPTPYHWVLQLWVMGPRKKDSDFLAQRFFDNQILKYILFCNYAA